MSHLLLLEMDTMIRVQILDGVIYISQSANILGKVMDPALSKY